MLGKDHGQPKILVESVQRREHFLRAPRIELTRRLVEGQDRGLQRERSGDCHALPFSTRQRRDLPIPQRCDAEQIEYLLDSLAHRYRRHAELLHPEGEFVVDPARYELGLGILENEPREPGQYARAVVARVMAGDNDDSVERTAAEVRRQPVEAAQQCRFATAGRPGHRNEFARGDGPIQVPQGGGFALRVPIGQFRKVTIGSRAGSTAPVRSRQHRGRDQQQPKYRQQRQADGRRVKEG